MGINLISPTSYTTAFLVADTQQTAGGSNDSISTMTQVNGQTVSAAMEIQSTSGMLLLPRMTTEQIGALPVTVDGMLAYNNNINAVQFLQNGSLSQMFSQVTVPLTAAQILGMYANPVQVLPAPAAGYAYLVQEAYIELVYGTVQFQNGGAVGIQYTNAAHLAGQPASGVVNGATIDGAVETTIYGIPSVIFLAALPVAAIIAQPLFISNDTAAFTTGDSTFNLVVTYSLILP